MKRKPPASQVPVERRDYFRIRDEVQLRYTCIDQSSALASRIPPEFRDDIGYSLVRELQLIDRDHALLLRAIAEENRDLESYLKAINRKIELIASMIASEHETLDHKEQQVVSLSEGGLSFRAKKELPHDGHLALQLTLLPSHMTLVLFGRVINCSTIEGDPNNGFSVAVSFINLSEEDRQTLARHVMQLQLARRRQDKDD